MKEIVLTRGLVALVDDADFEGVNQFNWHARKPSKRSGFYAVRSTRKSDGSRSRQFMHTFLMPEPVEIDHRDGNGLNNQRGNLRECTHLENLRAFRRKRNGASSVFRGVSKHREKWLAGIRVNGKTIYLGQFLIEKNAALAYDKAAREFFGDFAAPNFPALCRD